MERLPDISPGRLTFLTPDRTDAAMDLYRSCADYFLLQDGEPAGLADAEELFTDIPQSAAKEKLAVIGYWHGETLVGLASVLGDHPGKGDWYVGLMLLRPSIRRRGLGRRLYAAVEAWARSQGARQMLLCVFEQDRSAFEFWNHLGFELLRTVPPTQFKQKTHTRYEMARRLD